MQKPVFNKVRPFPPIKPKKLTYKQELIPNLTIFSDLKEFISKLEKEYPNAKDIYIDCNCGGGYDDCCDSLSERFISFSINNENFEEQNEQYLKDYKKYQTELKAYNKALKEFGVKNYEYKKFKKESKISLEQENKKLKELLEQVKTNPNFDKSVLDKV
jgi:hypothetical protein